MNLVIACVPRHGEPAGAWRVLVALRERRPVRQSRAQRRPTVLIALHGDAPLSGDPVPLLSPVDGRPTCTASMVGRADQARLVARRYVYLGGCCTARPRARTIAPACRSSRSSKVESGRRYRRPGDRHGHHARRSQRRVNACDKRHARRRKLQDGEVDCPERVSPSVGAVADGHAPVGRSDTSGGRARSTRTRSSSKRAGRLVVSESERGGRARARGRYRGRVRAAEETARRRRGGARGARRRRGGEAEAQRRESG